MKNILTTALTIALGLVVTNCESNNKHDKGYEAAWEGENKPSVWASREEKEGYEKGLDDAWMYDNGYYDGVNNRAPNYLEDPFYMDGFKDGKKDR